MIFVLAFSIFLIFSCFFVASFVSRLNLKVCLAFSSGVLITLCILDFLPHSFESSYPHFKDSSSIKTEAVVDKISSKDVLVKSLDDSLDDSVVAESVDSSKKSPHQKHHHAPFIGLFILLGILLQILADIYLLPYLSFLDRLLKVESQSKHQHSHAFNSLSVCSIAGCLSICSFFDGIRLWTAFQTEFFIAFSTAFGLFFHLLSEGVLIAGLALSSGFKKRVLFILLSILGALLLLGALIAQFLSYSLFFHNVLAFSSGCLMYICFVHLLPTSLKPALRYWFFAGVLSFSALHFIFELYFPH